MPKGEHFKKPNPRIIQVSFKVNQKEFDQLQALVKEEDTSVAALFRSIITGERSLNGAVVNESPQPKKEVVKEEPKEKVIEKVESKKVETPKPKPEPKPRPKHHDPTVSPNQMSLF